MISIVYPIKNRRVLFENTLQSIYRYLSDIDFDFEIIITDSGSNDNIEETIKNWKNKLDIKYIKYTYKNLQPFHNPAFGINLGIQLAKYNSVILSFPEVQHVTNAIVQFKKHVGSNVLARVYDLDPQGQRYRLLYGSDTAERKDNPGFYFLAMYNKTDFFSIGGIDEIYMNGIGYEDKDFGLRFNKARLKFTIDDNIIGEHQWHSREYQNGKQLENAQIFSKCKNNNEQIIVNTKIIPGDPKNILEII